MERGEPVQMRDQENQREDVNDTSAPARQVQSLLRYSPEDGHGFLEQDGWERDVRTDVWK
jgi:hypothetical protein